VLGWRRPGFGDQPLALFQAAQGQSSAPQQTWATVRVRLIEAVRYGCRSEGGFDAGGAGDSAGGGTLESEFGPGSALHNIDEGIDAIIEEEINADEASWLDIAGDVAQVKAQVLQMIFTDLIDETVAEIRGIWNGTTPS